MILPSRFRISWCERNFLFGDYLNSSPYGTYFDGYNVTLTLCVKQNSDIEIPDPYEHKWDSDIPVLFQIFMKRFKRKWYRWVVTYIERQNLIGVKIYNRCGIKPFMHRLRPPSKFGYSCHDLLIGSIRHELTLQVILNQFTNGPLVEIVLASLLGVGCAIQFSWYHEPPLFTFTWRRCSASTTRQYPKSGCFCFIILISETIQSPISFFWWLIW